jgi:hypothetical protein
VAPGPQDGHDTGRRLVEDRGVHDRRRRGIDHADVLDLGVPDVVAAEVDEVTDLLDGLDVARGLVAGEQ